MKKYSAIFMAIILGAIALLSGCELLPGNKDPLDKKQHEGGFLYYVKNESAIILDFGFREEECEELVIPETLGGYPVKQIGEIWVASVVGRPHYYGIHCNNVKKIIINHDCYLADCGIKQFDGDIIVNANVTITGNMYRWYESSEKKADGKYYAANNIQINADLEDYTDFRLFCYQQASFVSYEAMGGNLKTFYTIVKEGCYLKLPQDPVREGYNFGGWFKEEECLNEWNFEEDIIEEDITLYAKWSEI